MSEWEIGATIWNMSIVNITVIFMTWTRTFTRKKKTTDLAILVSITKRTGARNGLAYLTGRKAVSE